MLKKQRQFGPLLSEHQHKRVALPQVGGLACRAALGGDLGGRLASRLLGCHRVDFVLVGMRAIAARPYLAPLPRSKLVDPGGKRGPTLRGGASRAWFGPATCRARGGGPRRRVPARRRKSGDGPRLRAGRRSPRIPWTSCVGAPIRAAEFPYHARGAVPALDVQFDGPLPVFV